MCDIFGIHFDNCVWNAPVPQTFEQLRELNESDSGAIVFKTITLDPKIGNPHEWKLDKNGSLNKVGLHNGGIYNFMRILKKLEPIKPVFVSIYGSYEELFVMIDIINALEFKILIELNISCPNIMPIKNISLDELERLKNHSNFPLGIKVGYNQDIAKVMNNVDFISAINTINGRGGADIHNRAVQFVNILSKKTKTPIIGVGGIRTIKDKERFLQAGAIAVEIGTEYLRFGTEIFQRV